MSEYENCNLPLFWSSELGELTPLGPPAQVNKPEFSNPPSVVLGFSSTGFCNTCTPYTNTTLEINSIAI